ncbi:MAG: PEGA domain-containing protein [Kofleriaceae bacterium]
MRFPVGLAGAALASLVAAARADGTGAIVVRSVEPSVDVVALTAGLAAAGVDAPDALAATAAARRAGAEPAARLTGFAAVAGLVTEGWRAYVAADPGFAAARLGAARSSAQDLLALAGGPAVYADASLRLGVVLLHLGRIDEAAAALRLAHALDPERQVTTAEFTPDAVAAYQAAIDAPTVTMPVRIEALAGAEVEVDGVDRGPAPITAELAVGEHVVVVRHPGYRPFAQAVAVTPATALLTPTLEPDRGAAAVARAARAGLGALGERELAAAIDQVIALGEVDEVLVVASIARAGAPALVAQRCVGGRRCSAVVEVGYADAAGLVGAVGLLRQRLSAVELRYGVVLPDDARVTRRRVRVGRGEDRSRRRWAWLGGGALAAAVVATAVVLATSGDGPPVITVDPGDFTR